MKEVWLTTSYLGTVEYYRLLSGAETANIEAFENYEKQSWRNRFRILSANGPIDLSIPVIKGNSLKQPIREVRIDYRQNWQKIHFRSVESAYRHSPFYEFLIDEIHFLWEIQPESLFDYNRLAMEAVLKLMKSDVTVKLTQEYQKPGYYGSSDYRYSIHPKVKKQGTGYEPVPYHQVFADRFGFIQDLSILDWLFNDFRI
ncbi:MAG: WbqC family protein [Bacteroidales bacterium]